MGRSCSLVFTLVMMTSCLTYLAKSDAASAPSAVSTHPGHPAAPRTLPLLQQRQHRAQTSHHLQLLSDRHARDQSSISSVRAQTPHREARYSLSQHYKLPSPYQPSATKRGTDNHQPPFTESLLATFNQAEIPSSLGEEVLSPSYYSLPQQNSLKMTQEHNLRPYQKTHDLLLLVQGYPKLIQGLDSSFSGTQKGHLMKEKRGAPKYIGKRDVSSFDTSEFGLNPGQFSVNDDPESEVEFTQRDFPAYRDSKRRAPKFIGKRMFEQEPAREELDTWVLKRKAPKFVGRRRAPFFVGKRHLTTGSNQGSRPAADHYYQIRRGAPKFVGKRSQLLTDGPEEKRLNELDDLFERSYFAVEDKRRAPKFVGKRSVASSGRTLDYSSNKVKRSLTFGNHISRSLGKIENRIGKEK